MTLPESDRIYRDLESKIINGIYPIDTKLPPERELAVKYSTSRFIIREAISQLKKNGFAETRPQSGTYIKNFNEITSIDSLIKVIIGSKSIQLATLESMIQFHVALDSKDAAQAALNITKPELNFIETMILKKKMNDRKSILADCDYNIHLQIIQASKDIMNLAFTLSLKPLRIAITRLVYSLGDYKDIYLDYDINMFHALSNKDRDRAAELIAGKVKLLEKILLEKGTIENGVLKFP